MRDKIRQKLLKHAHDILDENSESIPNGMQFTKPSRTLYPFQWNWDSGFIAYAYAHYDVERGIQELRSLFMGQWKNGFLPHIIFHQEDKTYFPGPSFWESQIVSQDAPRGVATSGITQPPIHALALWHLYTYHTGTEQEKLALLREFYPKILSAHRYLMSERDPERWGLVTIYHPWESGFDNSPRWDDALENVMTDPDVLGTYIRTDIKKVNISERPTNAEYDKYVMLARNLKRHGYRDRDIYPEHPFKVKAKVFSTILYLANEHLVRMGHMLRQDTSEVEEWMERFRDNLVPRSWSFQKHFFCGYDICADKRIEVPTIGAVIPIITNILPLEKREELLTFFDEELLCTNENCATELALSASTKESFFNPENYWRGPIWMNVNWLLWKGFAAQGLSERAESLREHMIQLIEKNDFYEYYNPFTGVGIGIKDFSWTAALLIDLLSNHRTSEK